RSDLASSATEERHSPNPVFDPPRGETHRHRGSETRRRFTQKGGVRVRTSVASSSSHQTAEMGAVTLHSGLGNPTLRSVTAHGGGSATTRHIRKHCHLWSELHLELAHLHRHKDPNLGHIKNHRHDHSH
ncbi:unnamed protein product, partial [Pleuronectes platessa]